VEWKRVVKIFANIGAEETEHGRGSPRAERVVAPLQAVQSALWLLFDETSQMHGRSGQRPWPPFWGAVQPGHAFSCLNEVEGLFAWLPTPESRALAKKESLPHFGPEQHVVDRLHDKGHFLGLLKDEAPELLGFPPQEVVILEPEFFEGARCAEAIAERVATWPRARQRSFTLKPRRGTSGRGRLQGRDGQVRIQDRPGLSRLAQRGGAILESWLDRVADYSALFWIHPEGEVEILGTVQQLLHPYGGPVGCRGQIRENRADGFVTSGSAFDEALLRAARSVGQIAHRAGYFGPAGIDAFCHQTESGLAFRPVVELNARMTTSLIGLGLCNRALSSGLLGPGDAVAYLLFAPGPKDALPDLEIFPLFDAPGGLLVKEGKSRAIEALLPPGLLPLSDP
jgi:hypothetical protein